MVEFGSSRGHVVDMDGGTVLRGFGTIAAVIVVVILLWSSVAYVPAGNVGVLTLFGRVTNEALPEGMHFVNPFKVNNVMSVRTQQAKETASVPSNEGLIITLDTSLLFKLKPGNAADMYQKVGPNYIDIVVEPNLRSAIRSVTSMHSANALYSSERDKVAQQIVSELSA
jgi:prohibitin 1